MSYTLISTVTVGAGGQASIDFSNIPQVYSDLMVQVSVRTNRALTEDWVLLSLNGSTANFSSKILRGSGSAASSFTQQRPIGDVPSSNATSNTFSNQNLYLPNYSGSAIKTFSVDSVSENNATAAWQYAIGGVWASTAAVTSLTLTPEVGTLFTQYSTASIYGVNRIPTASLGAPTVVDYLVVAGGGGAGGGVGGGGGAGGYRADTAYPVTAGSPLSVTVGAGGAGGAGANPGTQGSNGSDSMFATIGSVGGGGGGRHGNVVGNTAGSAGGSGGGGSGYPSNDGLGGAGTSLYSQGYAGAAGQWNGGAWNGGGGGGAGAMGSLGAPNVGGAGGIGKANTLTGITTYYAGGGGGAGLNSGGVAGLGGGGAGGTASIAGANGLANTGGGGGGRDSGTGGAGGSGVVVIRYPDTYAAPTAVAGNPMLTFVNGYRVYTWTASGSITF